MGPPKTPKSSVFAYQITSKIDQKPIKKWSKSGSGGSFLGSKNTKNHPKSGQNGGFGDPLLDPVLVKTDPKWMKMTSDPGPSKPQNHQMAGKSGFDRSKITSRKYFQVVKICMGKIHDFWGVQKTSFWRVGGHRFGPPPGVPGPPF